MDTLQCAIVLAKLERFEWEIDQRIEIGQRYSELLASSRGQSGKTPSSRGAESSAASQGVAIPPITIRPDRTSVYAQYTVICSDRETIQAKLKLACIPTAIHYPVPLNEQHAYKHWCCPDCTPIASRLARQVMSLPMAPDLTAAQQEEIVAQFY